MKSGLNVEEMQLSEMALALDWAANEGWNPGVYDAGAFYAADPGGFFIAKTADEPLGMISAVRYTPDAFGFIGFFIVRRDCRGGKVGPLLAQTALRHLDGCCSGQDGVLAKVRNYETAGFRMAYRNCRYGFQSLDAGRSHPAIVPIGIADYADVFAYDRQCFPARREAFLREWLAQPETRSLLYRERGRLRGYGVLRRCRTGYKIGPLFADGETVAEHLLLALVQGVRGKVWLDVPEPNATAVRLAKKYRMTAEFFTARMYNGAAPVIALNKVFGVTSFELG